MTIPAIAALIPVLFILVLPLGVAGQNIGLGVSLFFLILLALSDRGSSLRAVMRSPLVRQFLILWFVMMIPVAIATCAHGKTKETVRFFVGYTYGALIPVGSVMLSLVDAKLKFANRVLIGVLVFLGLIAVSQMVFGWKIDHGTIVSAFHRAQGFYDHPLTFAYAFLFFVPWAIAKCMNEGFSKQALTIVLAMVAIVFCSQSVTVIAVSGLCVAAMAFFLLSRQAQMKLFSVGILIGIAAVIIPNPFAEKVHAVLGGNRGDHETFYPDDRMAFWHAHLEMFTDAPLMGHGTGLEAEDRAPYYREIGLGSIQRMYEAHNMFLQYAVEGGIVAVLALMALLVWLVRVATRIPNLAQWEYFYLVATPIVFGLAGMTQNAIQDSEVRFVFLGFVGVLLARFHAKN